MNEIIRLLSLFFDNNILNIVAYLGIFLTIYFSVRVRHKKIKYVVAKKEDEYVIVFWNSCSQSIFREDLFAFCLFANIDCICKTIYSTDSMVPLELSIGENGLLYDDQLQIRFNSLVKRIDLSFDFLNKRKGYILHIKNKPKSSYPSTKFAIYGRIRGESKDSIQYLKQMERYDTIGLKNIKKIALLIVNILFFTIFIMYILAGLIQTFDGIRLNDNTMIYNGLSVTVAFTIAFYAKVHFGYINRIPYDLNRKYKHFLRLNYKEVSSASIELQNQSSNIIRQ